MGLILASNSAARKAMLRGAGLTFMAEGPDVDEAAEKARLLTQGAGPADVAQALAKLKALSVSRARPEAWVLGSDQTLEFEGRLFDRAGSAAQAEDRLRMLRGRGHSLHSGVALARDGQLEWAVLDTARLHMRDFTDAFLASYLAADGDALMSCVGGYRLEGLGAQLFTRVEGDYFTVLGMPLWPVLAALRARGVIPT